MASTAAASMIRGRPWAAQVRATSCAAALGFGSMAHYWCAGTRAAGTQRRKAPGWPRCRDVAARPAGPQSGTCKCVSTGSVRDNDGEDLEDVRRKDRRLDVKALLSGSFGGRPSSAFVPALLPHSGDRPLRLQPGIEVPLSDRPNPGRRARPQLAPADPPVQEVSRHADLTGSLDDGQVGHGRKNHARSTTPAVTRQRWSTG